MKIKALVPFSNGTISMEQYEVREVEDSLGNELISAGVAVEISGGGSGGGPLVVTDTDGTLDASYQDIEDAGFFAVLHTRLSEIATQVDALSLYAHHDNGYGVKFGDASYVAANKTDNLALDK